MLKNIADDVAFLLVRKELLTMKKEKCMHMEWKLYC